MIKSSVKKVCFQPQLETVQSRCSREFHADGRKVQGVKKAHSPNFTSKLDVMVAAAPAAGALSKVK